MGLTDEELRWLRMEMQDREYKQFDMEADEVKKGESSNNDPTLVRSSE